MEKNFEWRDILDFGTCQRPDGSYYGHGGAKCHKGTEAQLSDKVSGHPVFQRLSESQGAALTQSLLDFETKLSSAGYQEDALEDWRAGQVQLLDALNASGADAGRGKYAYTPDQIVAKTDQQLTKANDLMVGKMPTHLDNGSGTFTQASLGMQPQFGASQLKWKDPVLGDKYGNSTYTREKGIKDAEKKAAKAEKLGDKTAAKIYRQRADDLRKLPEGSTLVVKNGVAPSRFSQWQEGNAQKMLEFKAKQEAAGKPWPMEPTKNPTQKEIDDFVKLNPKMWESGFNTQNKARGRDDAFDVYEAGSKTPSPRALAAREAKNRAMAASYLSYEGRSPVTGQPIKAPKSDLPTTKTVVDHVVPYRDIVKANPGKSIFELDAIANTQSNFMNVESDLNNSKNDRSWAQTAATLSKNQSTAAVRKSVTDNWNDRGSRVTLNRSEYEARFGTTKGFDSASDRRAIGSAHEQARLASTFGVSRSEMVPTARNRNSSAVSDGFTPPKGTVMKAGSPPVPKATRSAPKSSAPKPAQTTKVTAASRAQTQAKARAAQTSRQQTKLIKKQEDLVKKRRIVREKAQSRGGYTKKMQEAYNKLGSELRQVESQLEGS